MKPLIPILVAAAALTMPAAVTQAGGAEPLRPEFTSGEFHTLPAGVGLGYEITGTASMIRTGPADGHTSVTVRLTGLSPTTSYPTHVHNQPCNFMPFGGGHYQHAVGGAIDADNEIWPTVSTNPHGKGVGTAVHAWRARPVAQSVVVHQPGSLARLACVDLQ